MTFFNDLWKKFNAPTVTKDWTQGISQNTHSDNEVALAESYSDAETEYLQSTDIVKNLEKLKRLMAETPTAHRATPAIDDFKANLIQTQVGIPESYETLRQEREATKNLQCPQCHSNNLKRLAQLPSQSAHNHRYRCMECLLEFNDDSGTLIEIGQPPVNIWMQCWYLMGCTDSLTYIASRLNLDLVIVERMADELKRLFQMQKPVTQFLDFETWKKQSDKQFKQLKDDLVKQFELLDANVASVPKDSAEFRRQQTLRRTTAPTLDPTAGVRGPRRR